MALVDVLMLSFCQSQREYAMTAAALETLVASEVRGTFRIVLVETASAETLKQWSSGAPFGEEVEVVFPNRPFHYNDFLQIGFSRLQENPSPYLLIVNNDVLFEAGFAQSLLRAMATYDSVSPWCPGYHEHHFGEAEAFEGRRTSLELCGWAIMFPRRILQRVSFAELFPSEFSFWFQDNYYGHQLARHGLRHALVRQSRVRHLFEQSHGLLSAAEHQLMTQGSAAIFESKIAAESPVQLTVAIPTLQSRVGTMLSSLLANLERQAADKPVEVLCLLDNRTMSLGRKRNVLATMARGIVSRIHRKAASRCL